MIRQRWTPYWEWEDYHAGMWRKIPRDQEAEWVALAVRFTGNTDRYGKWMRKVVMKWPRTMINALTNPSINQLAFVGHCAACYALHIPEYITRMAWGELTDKQRTDANQQAREAIELWRKKHLITLGHGSEDVTIMGYQMKCLPK